MKMLSLLSSLSASPQSRLHCFDGIDLLCIRQSHPPLHSTKSPAFAFDKVTRRDFVQAEQMTLSFFVKKRRSKRLCPGGADCFAIVKCRRGNLLDDVETKQL
jgi:hypothetical protein